MRRFYSRLVATEEKSNKRRAYIYIGLSIVSFLLLIFFGLPSIVKMAAFLSDLRKSNTTVEKNDITPPAPPRIDNLPEATNKKSFDIQGSSEEGITVKIYFNDTEETLISDNSGRFTATFDLIKGENKISAKAVDQAGNESQTSEEKIVIYDNDAPKLEIASPENNKNFYGSKQRQIVINGSTEEGSSISINERFVSVEEDGTFAFASSLSEGENVFDIKATDDAGNSTETSLTLNYSL